MFSGIFGKRNNNISINGNQYSVEGNNVSVINDKIYVDGKLIQDGLSGIVKIEWLGDVANRRHYI